jgi:2-oxoglutarate dehydrogenase E2 component (dihydrolipoamide succinyltransferase)
MQITIPSPGESVTEVTISTWLKQDGDVVRKNDELFEIESDKATLSVSAEADGVLHVVIPAGTTAKVGSVAATIDATGAPALKPKPASEATLTKVDTVKKEVRSEPAPVLTAYTKDLPSVAAQKLMAETGVSLSEVNGSGRGGRITKADVLDRIPSQPPLPEIIAAPTPPPVPPSGHRLERRVAMTKLRLKVSERLVAAKNTTAMLTTFNEIDMSKAIALRQEYKDRFKEKYGIGLGYMSIFTRAAVLAIADFPAVNAFIDGEEIIYHDFADIGIAVQAPKGLVVPVVRNAETLALHEIEIEIDRLAGRARNNQLTLEEMSGGTFTISNGGIFGNLMSTPILNPPQSGILGMHKIMDRPIAENGQVVIRPMMYVAMSYDHRIIDGRESVGFLKRVKELVEDPIRMWVKV